MPSACYAMGCTNALSQKKGLAFYKFPKDPVRRQKWITRDEPTHANVRKRQSFVYYLPFL
uniref:THAP-type domain-containing protein n=1 Tax=Neogobius melanostomus TaxID=47308 RepID=A0A8C6TNC3_9GOBI